MNAASGGCSSFSRHRHTGAVLLHALLAETEARPSDAAVPVSVNVEGGEAPNQLLMQSYPHLRP
jgi:hypothetical protein